MVSQVTLGLILGFFVRCWFTSSRGHITMVTNAAYLICCGAVVLGITDQNRNKWRHHQRTSLSPVCRWWVFFFFLFCPPHVFHIEVVSLCLCLATSSCSPEWLQSQDITVLLWISFVLIECFHINTITQATRLFALPTVVHVFRQFKEANYSYLYLPRNCPSTFPLFVEHVELQQVGLFGFSSPDPPQAWGGLTRSQETLHVYFLWSDFSSPDSGCNSNYSIIWSEPCPHESCIDLAHFQSLMFATHNQECLCRQLICYLTYWFNKWEVTH